MTYIFEYFLLYSVLLYYGLNDLNDRIKEHKQDKMDVKHHNLQEKLI